MQPRRIRKSGRWTYTGAYKFAIYEVEAADGSPLFEIRKAGGRYSRWQVSRIGVPTPEALFESVDLPVCKTWALEAVRDGDGIWRDRNGVALITFRGVTEDGRSRMLTTWTSQPLAGAVAGLREGGGDGRRFMYGITDLRLVLDDGSDRPIP